MTLDYIAQLIPAARAAGYTFETMPQVQPWLQERTGPAQVTGWDRVTLWVATALFALPGHLLQGLFVLALVTMLGFGLVNTLLALARARWGRRRLTTATPPVTVLIAAYNEEAVIGRTLEQVLSSAYPVEEVLVVDDGSTDGTADVVRAVAAVDPRVRLVQQRNGGKWSALNRGLDAARSEHVVTLDADTLFTPDTIRHLMARFHSPRVGAVAGVIKVGNVGRNVLTRWQALEYLTQIGVDRAACALLDAVMIVPGACAAWRKTAVLQAGGYSDATLAEDCDLTLMLHRHGWRVEQADEALAYTEAPETADALVKQRIRWMYGTLQATWRHRRMLFRPRYGFLGMVIMPMSVLTVVVPLVFTPVVAGVLAHMVLVQGSVKAFLYLGGFSAIYGLVALVAVLLLRERPAHLAMVPVYRLIYEPLRAYLLYASLGTALRGIRLGWNKLDRTAHVDQAALQQIGAQA
jgi:biofilm PGA synthesis N-glycosyltransferase PgaC